MKLFQLFIIAILCFYECVALPQKNIKLTSPDGHIQYSFTLKNKEATYKVFYNGKQIITDAALNLSFKEGGIFNKSIKIGVPTFSEGREQYELIVGKNKKVDESYNQVVIPLEENAGNQRKIHLVVRAFNDGLAFRYVFPEQKNWSSFQLTEENTNFKIAENPKVLTLQLPNYTTSHEGEYTSALYNDLKEDTLMDMPTLFQFPGNIYLAITEAALVNYAGMYLIKHKGILTSRLSPLPGQTEIKVKGNLPHKTPWRVLMIGNRIGTLMESNILTNLNEPNKIEDVSWIKPGKTTFPWWNGSIIPDTTFAPGNNFENNQYYIDFCARNGIEYHSIVESCGHEWYTNDGENYQPGPNVDITKPVPTLDMQRICDYAKTKGVGIRVWVHWKALYPKLDTAFSLFEKWGIKGMMVDFMDRDDQEMTNIKEEILIKAAKHKLHIQFHGTEKPTGLSRTYPNEFTREGTLNYEVNKWDNKITPDHDLNIVFSRMLAGPTDYHLGGFRAVPDSFFKVQYTRPLMLGTRGHMLAMYVVLESYQGMVCDYPEAYEAQPGFDFVKAVPTIWDETKVLDAKVGEYVIIGRRKGENWFVGAITGSKARKVNIDLSFLKTGNWEAIIYKDADDVGINPNNLNILKKTFTPNDAIDLQLAIGGGAAIQFLKK